MTPHSFWIRKKGIKGNKQNQQLLFLQSVLGVHRELGKNKPRSRSFSCNTSCGFLRNPACPASHPQLASTRNLRQWPVLWYVGCGWYWPKLLRLGALGLPPYQTLWQPLESKVSSKMAPVRLPGDPYIGFKRISPYILACVSAIHIHFLWRACVTSDISAKSDCSTHWGVSWNLPLDRKVWGKRSLFFLTVEEQRLRSGCRMRASSREILALNFFNSTLL